MWRRRERENAEKGSRVGWGGGGGERGRKGVDEGVDKMHLLYSSIFKY